MGSKGGAYDNTAAESFFHMLKVELVNLIKDKKQIRRRKGKISSRKTFTFYALGIKWYKIFPGDFSASDTHQTRR